MKRTANHRPGKLVNSDPDSTKKMIMQRCQKQLWSKELRPLLGHVGVPKGNVVAQ